MDKDFDGWSVVKKRLDQRSTLPLFEERQIWWCSVGINVGHEQDGRGGDYRRPVLVLRKFNRHIFYGVPLSLRVKNNPFYFPFVVGGVRRSALLSQVRLWDAHRLTTKMVKVPEGVFKEIKAAVRGVF